MLQYFGFGKNHIDHLNKNYLTGNESKIPPNIIVDLMVNRTYDEINNNDENDWNSL